jgi:hypothetical protein
MNESITKAQLDLMVHTLGSWYKKNWYRNHFVAGPGHSDMDNLLALEKLGFMAKSRRPSFCPEDQIVFHVTEKGKDYLR